ncbi:BglG family transcription antiterminator [Lacrimispora sp.]|jgi:lichenan operon transcriptional antiterminator|uniref:BglG family transcription antiterminator n=1 Tax=Lacrimispora sp. TaxID=2719234 RepID=UPI00289CAA83|nr:PTS sugar transporter subunit IIA [Lacrimispora sp.]
MNTRLTEILNMLTPGCYVTAKELAERLGVSTKTVGLRVKELNERAASFGFSVEAKPRCGYALVLDENNGMENFISQERQRDRIPSGAKERVSYLLAYLVNYNDYIRLDDLCEFLYISRATLTGPLKEAEEILNRYGIRLDRRPNYGIRAAGDEFDFRRCIGDYFIKRNMLEENGEQQKKELEEMGAIIFPMLKKYGIHLSETAFELFAIQIYIAAKRIRRGRLVKMPENSGSVLGDREWEFVKELLGELSRNFKIRYNQDEATYTAVWLAGKRMIGNVEKDEVNFVISEEIDRLVSQMLQLVDRDFKMEFSSHFDIRMLLNQHMVPFDIRMRYNIPVSNLLLKDIMKKCFFEYIMAISACTVLAEWYQKPVPEEEVGYFALIFALAEEQKKTKDEKKNILIVCSTGRGSSRLLKLRYGQEFGEYLNHIYICDLSGLENFDFDKVEYVFTTVPIHRYIPRPIIEIGHFLESEDIPAIRTALEGGRKVILTKYYKRDYFFTNMEGETRAEVIKNLCERIGRKRSLPKGFYEAVLKREDMAQTDFGNLIAIPHPCEVMTEETFVSVAILKEPVLWSRHPVQVVLLVSIGKEEEKGISDFYKYTSKLALSQEAVQELIKKKDFDVLIRLLQAFPE